MYLSGKSDTGQVILESLYATTLLATAAERTSVVVVVFVFVFVFAAAVVAAVVVVVVVAAAVVVVEDRWPVEHPSVAFAVFAFELVAIK